MPVFVRILDDNQPSTCQCYLKSFKLKKWINLLLQNETIIIRYKEVLFPQMPAVYFVSSAEFNITSYIGGKEYCCCIQTSPPRGATTTVWRAWWPPSSSLVWSAILLYWLIWLEVRISKVFQKWRKHYWAPRALKKNQTEEKAKVVAAVWGTYLNAAL